MQYSTILAKTLCSDPFWALKVVDLHVKLKRIIPRDGISGKNDPTALHLKSQSETEHGTNLVPTLELYTNCGSGATPVTATSRHDHCEALRGPWLPAPDPGSHGRGSAPHFMTSASARTPCRVAWCGWLHQAWLATEDHGCTIKVLQIHGELAHNIS